MARPRLSDDTRQKLLDEGVRTFLEKGFHGAGLKEILDSCAVPKGSFYNYFASKEDFGAESIRHYGLGFGARFDAAIASSNNAMAGLEKFFKALMRDFKKSDYRGGCLVANLAGEIESSDVCRPVLKETFDSWRDAVAKTLVKAQEDGSVRADIPARVLADILTESWEGAVIRMKIEKSLKPLERCLKHVLGELMRPS